MHVDGDERFELDSLKLLQVLGGLVDEQVEQVEEALVRGWHDLFIVARIAEGLFRVTSPDHLNA